MDWIWRSTRNLPRCNCRYLGRANTPTLGSMPKLVLFLNEPALTVTNSGIKGWYYILSVKNTRRSTPAQNVRILLSEMFKKGPDGAWQEKKFSGPTQVKWRWPGSMPLYTTVGPEAHATFVI